MWRWVPSTIFSSASVKSASATRSCCRRAASSAASLTRFARSAPTIPDVEAASEARSTSSARGTLRVCTARICWRPSWSGALTTTRRSKRPARSSAESSTSGRLVDATTITPSEPVKPSISVRIWLSVCSRSSLPPYDPDPRTRPIASSSSMKMIAGAAALAWLKRSRTRLAPTPTIASMNSDAAIEKNGTSASPATARASSVLPVPGAPESSTPRGTRAPEPRVLVGAAQEVDDLGQLVGGLVDAGHVLERDPLLVALVSPRLRLAERPQRAAGQAAAEPPRDEHEQTRPGAASARSRAAPPPTAAYSCPGSWR